MKTIFLIVLNLCATGQIRSLKPSSIITLKVILYLGFAIRCQVCDNNGLCSSDNDLGIEKECGAEFNACIYQTTTAVGQTVTLRQCFVASNPECTDINANGVTTKKCICTSNACNKDTNTCCGTNAEPEGPKTPLMCQVCGNDPNKDPKCNDINDKGTSKQCPADSNVCILVQTNRPGEPEVYRGCGDRSEDRPLCEYDQKVISYLLHSLK